MKPINLFTVDSNISPKQVYNFLRVNYEYVDVIVIPIHIFEEELADRGIMEVDLPQFFKKIFDNEYWKNNADITDTPSLAFEIYEFLIANCTKEAGFPCVSENGSFLDTCYHYSIPIFVPGLTLSLDNYLGYTVSWDILDDILIDKIDSDYKASYFKLLDGENKIELGFNYDHRFPKLIELNIKDHDLPTKLFKVREKSYKELSKQSKDDIPYTKESLTYLFDELYS